MAVRFDSLVNYSVIIRKYYDEEVFVKAESEEAAIALATRIYSGHTVVQAWENNTWWTKHYKGVRA